MEETKWHGTAGGYTNYKCRCDECRKAWNKYCMERRATAGKSPRRHGTASGYVNGCKCTDCTLAQNYYHQSLNSSKNTRVKSNSEEYAKRSGICDCCKKVSAKLQYDHDHVTNNFRGYICSSCNTGIGKLGDNIDGVKAALEYLIKTGIE